MSANVAQIPFTVIGHRLRKSPFFTATRLYGCKAYSVYNHMYMPLFYGDPVSDYWNLINHVALWDVSCQRQVEITGPEQSGGTRNQQCREKDMKKCL